MTGSQTPVNNVEQVCSFSIRRLHQPEVEDDVWTTPHRSLHISQHLEGFHLCKDRLVWGHLTVCGCHRHSLRRIKDKQVLLSVYSVLRFVSHLAVFEYKPPKSLSHDCLWVFVRRQGATALFRLDWPATTPCQVERFSEKRRRKTRRRSTAMVLGSNHLSQKVHICSLVHLEVSWEEWVWLLLAGCPVMVRETNIFSHALSDFPWRPTGDLTIISFTFLTCVVHVVPEGFNAVKEASWCQTSTRRSLKIAQQWGCSDTHTIYIHTPDFQINQIMPRVHFTLCALQQSVRGTGCTVLLHNTVFSVPHSRNGTLDFFLLFFNDASSFGINNTRWFLWHILALSAFTGRFFLFFFSNSGAVFPLTAACRSTLAAGSHNAVESYSWHHLSGMCKQSRKTGFD